MSPTTQILLIVFIVFCVLFGPIMRVRAARQREEEKQPHKQSAPQEPPAMDTLRTGAAQQADERDDAPAAPAPRAATPLPPAGTPYQLNTRLLALAYTPGATNAGTGEGDDKSGDGKGGANNTESFTFSTHEIGLLEITSGAVAASDPLVNPAIPPFTRAVPKGRFPVRIAVATNAGGDERIAFAKVEFSQAAPVRWEMALIEGQDAATLRDGEFFGYGVDAGTGCFMDPRAGSLLEAKMDEVEDYYEVIIDAMDNTYKHTRSWVDLRPDPNAAENVICFTSGWGDGSYPSFFGLDGEGRPAVLVTDFLVVPA
jgi:hypothetical protein